MRTGIVYLLLSIAVSSAQEKPVPTYRLQFRFLETSPVAQRTAPNVRNYSLLLSGKSRGKINASRRIPHYTRGKDNFRELHTVALGTIIECSAVDREDGVQVDCALESSFAAREQPVPLAPADSLPVMISRQVTAAAVVPLGREIQFVRLDDPSSNSRLEIYLTTERFPGPVH